MDPVSATISLAASVVTLMHVANRLVEFAAKFKGLEKTFKILSRDVKGLFMLVNLLKKIIDNVEGALDSLTVTQQDKEEHALPLFNCDVEEIAKELNQLLESCVRGQDSRGWSKWFRRVAVKGRYFLKEGKVKELTARMGRAQSNLVTVVSMASLKMHADARAPPVWASGVEDVMQQVSKLPNAVEQHITAQFNTITEQMLREKRLRPASPDQQGGPPASASCQENMAFSNRSTTSLTASIRSLPNLLRKKPRGGRGVQEEATASQTNAYVSFAKGPESMIGGASIVDFTLDDQHSIHETTNNADFIGNAILHGNDNTAATSLPSVERLTFEDACGLPYDDKDCNALTSLSEGRGQNPPNADGSAWRRSSPSPRITPKTLETSPHRRPRRYSNALSISPHLCSESSASSSCSRKTKESKAWTQRQSYDFETQRGEDTNVEPVDPGAKQSNDEASEASYREPDIQLHPEPDDDPDVFALVVKVANSRTDGVPENAKFDTLLQFLLLAHKYRLSDETSKQAKIWFRHLKDDIPTSLDGQMSSWLWISWELGMRTEFKALSAIAQKEARGPIDQGSQYKVPLPDFIPDLIQEKRLRVFSEVKNLFESETKSIKMSYRQIFTNGSRDFQFTPHLRILMRSLVFGYLTLEGSRWFRPIDKHGEVSDNSDDSSISEFDGVSFSDICCYAEALVDLGDWCIRTIPPSERMPTALSMLSSLIPVLEVGWHTVGVIGTLRSSSAIENFTSLIERLKKSDWGIDLDDERS